MLLIYLILILFCLVSNRSKQRQYPIYRKPSVDTGFKFRKKPRWVINRIIEHKAFMQDAGCRSIATSFNRRFGHRETVSKTWVYNTIKKYQYEIACKRRKIKNRKPKLVAINEIWGMDMTGKHDENGSNQQILGIIDHGSRASIVLKYIESKSSLFLLGEIFRACQKYGKPKFIRTDNEAVFTSKVFKLGLRLLGIKHQTTDVGCPWQNGRIERFFGTLKEKLNQVMITDANHLNWHLKEFRFWYNCVRTHQNIDNRTPNEVWTRKGFKRQAKFYSGWDGILTGFHHPSDG